MAEPIRVNTELPIVICEGVSIPTHLYNFMKNVIMILKILEKSFDIGLLKLGSSGLALKSKGWKKNWEGGGGSSAITLANVCH